MGLIDRPEIDITPWCIRLKPAAEISPKLREYQDENGKIDFGNTDALNAYNKAALRVMSGLKLQLPPRNLVPTICLRQAYLTVLIDELLSRGSNILEIGTGASAVISMIASKNHGLNVTATELSDESYQSALNNIEMNKLENISLIKSSGGIIKGVISPETSFDAVLCYPPTYPEGDRKEYRRTKPLSGFKGTESEMIGGGDEGYTPGI